MTTESNGGKASRYQRLLADVEAVLGHESDAVAWMATLSCLIRQHLGFFWVGFYRVVCGELVIGPYQGTPGCMRIPFHRGVCGACATRRETIVVPDVHRFPDHIACDSRSNSEIVVPVFDREHRLRAVLDIDSLDFGTFDQEDRHFLELIAQKMAGLKWTDPL